MKKILIKLEYDFAFLLEVFEKEIGVENRRQLNQITLSQRFTWERSTRKLHEKVEGDITKYISDFCSNLDGTKYARESFVNIFRLKPCLREYKINFRIFNIEGKTESYTMCDDIAYQFEFEIKFV